MSATPDTARQATAPPPPRLYRSSDGRVLAGVARGLADHLGVDVLVVRLAFVLLAAAGGAGVATYGLFWVFAPQNPYEAEAPRDRRAGPHHAAGARLAHGGRPAAALGPGHRAAAGPRRPAGRGGRRRQHPLAAGRRRRAGPLAGGHRDAPVQRRGAGRRRRRLVVVGAAAILGPANLDGTAGGLVAALVVAAGLALVSSPWWVRMARDLAAERSARIREQERAEVAAHVHDSVLHTLTLIQRHVDDPREVTRLARAQERELRGWLYRPAPDATPAPRGRAGARWPPRSRTRTASPIEVVVVGDCRARRPARRPCATRPARRWSTPRSTPAARAGVGLRRGRAGRRSTCSSATAGRASTRTPSPRTGSACDSRCAAGWTATAAPPPSGSSPGDGTEVAARDAPPRPGART